MVDIYLRYDGELHCTARHGPSDTRIGTDAPVDNHGRGESFSPTDLVGAALGSCMLTVMGILAEAEGWDIRGIDVHVRKEMTKSLPRRVDQLVVDFSVPAAVAKALDADAKQRLEHAALHCPVRLSIAESIRVPVSFGW